MRPKFMEEQIIAMLREQGRRIRRSREDGRSLPQARDQWYDVLRLEGEVRRHGASRRQEAEGDGGGERQGESPARGPEVGEEGGLPDQWDEAPRLTPWCFVVMRHRGLSLAPAETVGQPIGELPFC